MTDSTRPDYHLPLLQELSTQVAAPDATDTLKAQYDILLTEAGLRAAYHLAFGKVAPESFDAQWNYGRTLPGTDLPQAIENAIASETVYDRLAALKPALPLYALLETGTGAISQHREGRRVVLAAGGFCSQARRKR